MGRKIPNERKHKKTLLGVLSFRVKNLTTVAWRNTRDIKYAKLVEIQAGNVRKETVEAQNGGVGLHKVK